MSPQSSKDSLIHSDKPISGVVYHRFCHAVNECMRMSPYDRPMIAERMNMALEAPGEIDQSKINKWFAPSQPNQIPMWYLPALCWALESVEFVNELLAPIMFKATDHRAQMLQNHAELQMEIEQKKAAQEEILSALLDINSK
ncbi:MAG: hypothetical protein VX100_07315 [Pseudomonadota bacterium]|nr:hypothetical protein [Pseudomonadota bacterium]